MLGGGSMAAADGGPTNPTTSTRTRAGSRITGLLLEPGQESTGLLDEVGGRSAQWGVARGVAAVEQCPEFARQGRIGPVTRRELHDVVVGQARRGTIET